MASDTETHDFVIVGSGAGGGPLAANLAEAGYDVLVLEAGGDDAPPEYAVPAFHALASEQPDMSWQMFVDLYDDPQRAARNSKLVPGKGIFYPRAGTLGGCTAHHAMITITPHNSDWDQIATLTGDTSWASGRMRSYFERLERCTYRDRPKVLPRNALLARLLGALPLVSDRFVNKGRHGFDGWLETRLADPGLILRDGQLFSLVVEAAESSLQNLLHRRLRKWEAFASLTDPNDWRVARSKSGGEGLWRVPTSISTHGRSGARERLLAARNAHPDALRIRTGALACRILFDEQGAAYGVEYVETKKAYRASDPPGEADLQRLQTAVARHEVILSAGAFNTPQLLMLSGVGPREELQRHGITCRVDLPGVGRNLQDRYEVGVVSEAESDFALLEDAAFRPWRDGDPPDPEWKAWLDGGAGVYATNGALVGIVHRSRPELPDPDLFVFGLPADFRGYRPGYSEHLEQRRNRFTWAILKAHTGNTAGAVRLRSSDPRDPPMVNFHYFDEAVDNGTPGSQGDVTHDLDDVVTGIELVRALNRRASVIKEELVPGAAVATRDQLREFVAAEAWGHHASCTARIGKADDPMAVVDSNLAVHGVPRLRVVDASVFPRIPGFFIVTPTYMVSEKASDVIIAAARSRTPARPSGTVTPQRESA